MSWSTMQTYTRDICDASIVMYRAVWEGEKKQATRFHCSNDVEQGIFMQLWNMDSISLIS